MNLYDLLLAPFAEFDFMHYALASVFCLSSAPHPSAYSSSCAV